MMDLDESWYLGGELTLKVFKPITISILHKTQTELYKTS
jgi:hypothetical protein